MAKSQRPVVMDKLSSRATSLPCTCSVNKQMDLFVLEFIFSISMTTDGEGEGESKGDLFEGGQLT
jgi:hypothetical protein